MPPAEADRRAAAAAPPDVPAAGSAPRQHPGAPGIAQSDHDDTDEDPHLGDAGAAHDAEHGRPREQEGWRRRQIPRTGRRRCRSGCAPAPSPRRNRVDPTDYIREALLPGGAVGRSRRFADRVAATSPTPTTSTVERDRQVRREVGVVHPGSWSSPLPCPARDAVNEGRLADKPLARPGPVMPTGSWRSAWTPRNLCRSCMRIRRWLSLGGILAQIGKPKPHKNDDQADPVGETVTLVDARSGHVAAGNHEQGEQDAERRNAVPHQEIASRTRRARRSCQTARPQQAGGRQRHQRRELELKNPRWWPRKVADWSRYRQRTEIS